MAIIMIPNNNYTEFLCSSSCGKQSATTDPFIQWHGGSCAFAQDDDFIYIVVIWNDYKVIGLHHYALHMSPAMMEETYGFYRDIFGAESYKNRPDIGYGSWVDMPGDIQIHILGGDGPSRFAKGPDQDPVHPHIAYAVADVMITMAELEQAG